MTKLRDQVSEFHGAFDVPVCVVPAVPADDRVRLRLRLIAEEFFELLEACGIDGHNNDAGYQIMCAINEEPLNVDLPEFADACADLDYVVEGSRLEFGINGEPIADAVHAANMAKVGGPVFDGKIRKPEGWQPPRIADELERQGWRP